MRVDSVVGAVMEPDTRGDPPVESRSAARFRSGQTAAVIPELSGDSVALRPVSASDVDELLRIARVPESIEDFQRAATSRDDVLEWLQPAIDGEEQAWVIVADDAVVGLVSLEPDGELTDAEAAELGYFVDVDCAGRGFATDAVRTVSAWTFESTSIRRLDAGISLRNPASIRVVEKAGFRHVRTLERDWEWDGQLWDSAYYELHAP